MIRNERRKLIKDWANNWPKKDALYKYMINAYKDEKNRIKYSKNEAVRFISALSESEANQILLASKANEDI